MILRRLWEEFPENIPCLLSQLHDPVQEMDGLPPMYEEQTTIENKIKVTIK